MPQQFSHYEILEPIGAGGMGEVYRARDTQLDRDVAIKILPEAFSADRERLARFEREAKLLASLNHPNIAAIYAIAREGNRVGLALELVEGEDLAERLKRGALPMDEALDVAYQVATAMEYAHEQGIVHRDLKPANIKITPDGKVKVLDFGLAKAVDTGQASPDDPSITQSPTMMGSTQAGMIMGTAAYMSPEQARGKPLDRRTDIFSFGVVLYEMLTGSRPFDGETISDTLASILAREAELETLPANTPPAIRLLIERCLEKDSKRRIRDVGEACLIIDAVRGGDTTATAILGAASTPDAPAPARSGIRPREMVAWVLVLAAVAAIFVVRAQREPVVTTAPPAMRKLSVPIEGGSDIRYSRGGLALSPDGSRVAYINKGKLFVRRLDRWDPIEIADSDDASSPCWSPNSEWVAFAIERMLWKVRPDGTERTRICEAEEEFSDQAGGAWLSDGRLVFRGRSDLYAVPVSGGNPSVFVSTEDSMIVDFHQPEALPGGTGVLTVVHTQSGVNSIGVVSLDGTFSIVKTIPGGNLNAPVYAPSGHVLYTNGADLWALPFDLETTRATGEPVVVARDTAVPTVSNDGTLAYVRGAGVVLRQLVLVDRNGVTTSRFGKPTDMWAMYALSPDGHRAATTGSGNDDIYLHHDRGGIVRATFTNIEHDMISFSPDGRELYFATGTEQAYRIGSKTVDNSDPEKVLVDVGEMAPHYYASCPVASKDGTILFYSAKGDNRKQDVAWVDLTGDKKPKRFLATAAAEYAAIPSPVDHKYVAYVSDESGKHQIYVTTFPDADIKLAVSLDTGLWPRWKGDGSELYFADGNDIYAASVSYDPLRVAPPVKLFSRPDADDRQPFGWPATFDVTADGNRFLVTEVVEREDAEPLIAIIPNWAASFTASNSE